MKPNLPSPQNLVLLEQLANEQAAGKSNELGQTLRQSGEALRPLAAVLAKQGIDIGTEIPDFIKRLGNADESALGGCRVPHVPGL